MPQLYPLKMKTQGLNFAANGVSNIPPKDAVDEKAKLFSKNFYAKLKNKTMTIPSYYKEDLTRPPPEKQKLPVMSAFRRLQLEDVRDREFMQAKKNRLFFYINQKFVNKFGSAHKHSIAASVEDFLDDNQDVTIDVHDLRLLDAIISDSIKHKKEEQDVLRASDLFTRGKSNLSGTADSKKSLSQSKSLNTLPLGKDWAIIRQHRSLSQEERLNSDLINTHNVHMRRLQASESQSLLEKEIAKLKEIENYRSDPFMAESMKLVSYEELREKKAIQEKKEEKFRLHMAAMAEKVQREAAERELSNIEKEKEAIKEKKRIMNHDKNELSGRLRAVTYKERIFAEQGDLKLDMSVNERVREDSDYRLHTRKLGSVPNRLTKKIIEEKHLEDKLSSSEFNAQSMRDTRKMNQTDELDFSKYVDEDLVEFKLSQNTFKKTVLRKQEEHKNEIRKQAAERRKSISDYNKTNVDRCNMGKNPAKIGNMTMTLDSYSMGKTL